MLYNGLVTGKHSRKGNLSESLRVAANYPEAFFLSAQTEVNRQRETCDGNQERE